MSFSCAWNSFSGMEISSSTTAPPARGRRLRRRPSCTGQSHEQSPAGRDASRGRQHCRCNAFVQLLTVSTSRMHTRSPAAGPCPIRTRRDRGSNTCAKRTVLPRCLRHDVLLVVSITGRCHHGRRPAEINVFGDSCSTFRRMISASISDSDAGRLLGGKNAPAVAALMWDCGCSCQLLADQLLAEWPAAWRSRPANIGVQRLCPCFAVDDGFAVDFFD